MRTTLDIDEEVLAAAKELARREHKATGRIVSDLLRLALTRSLTPAATPESREADAFYGFRPFASRGGVVTNAVVDGLRDEEGV